MTEEEKAAWIEGIKIAVALVLSSSMAKMINIVSSRVMLEMMTYYAIAQTNMDAFKEKEISLEKAEFIWTNSKIIIQEELDKLFPVGESK